MGRVRLVMLDEIRIWLTRLLAPLVFLAAATVLVVVVQRALDDDGGAAATTSIVEPVDTSPAVETDQTEVPAADREFYRIRAGDTLEGIAADFDTTVDELLLLNPQIDPLALEPGRRIRVA